MREKKDQINRVIGLVILGSGLGTGAGILAAGVTAHYGGNLGEQVGVLLLVGILAWLASFGFLYRLK